MELTSREMNVLESVISYLSSNCFIATSAEEVLANANIKLVEGINIEDLVKKRSAENFIEIVKAINKRELDELKQLDAYKKAAKTLGEIKSEKKAKSSRENGKKGGRPKKDNS